MARDLPIGNGSMLVAFDADYRVADLFFPHVGMENHAGSRFRFGLFADGEMRWIEHPQWQKSLHYLRDTLVTDVHCENEAMGIKLRCHDAIDSQSSVYLRKVSLRNLRPEDRRVKLFFHQDLNIYGNAIGDTALFDPGPQAILHYKGRRYFLINVASNGQAGVSEYECGRSGIAGNEGTWRDAEDGQLSMTPIAQGAVDSTIAVTVELEANGSATVLYWLCAGRRYREVRQLDARVRAEGAGKALSRTASYWYTWAHQTGDDYADLPDEIIDFYRRSLLVVRTQCDNGGAVLAANDSDIQWGHNDHYSYVWGRDAAFVCDAMDRAGYPELTPRYLQFAAEVLHEEGYLLHKYNPDGTFAPLWHGWVQDGQPQLPIQEDETALLLWLMGRHYQRRKNLELLRALYEPVLVRCADFLMRFRDEQSGLPLPSYDLWEERRGIFTFTCAAVAAGLQAAADIAGLFNDQDRRTAYERAAEQVRDATVRQMWLEEEGRFARGFVAEGDHLALDRTVDASVFALFYLDVVPASSATMAATMAVVREKLWVGTEVGGLARYEGDAYHRISGETQRVPGNPWLICTLWLAEHVIARATTTAELQSALDLVRWARSKASPSLVLPEQIDPYSGQPLSVAPLTWSHAQVVSVVRGYLDAYNKMRIGASEGVTRNAARKERENPVDNQESIT